MKRLLLASCAVSLMAGTAFAGHSAVVTTDHRLETDIHNVAHDVQGALETASDAILAHYVTPGEADFVASSLINANVKNNSNETIGEIKDIVIRNNSIEGVVIGVGGFLGVGQRYVVVDPSTMHMRVENGVWHISTNATRESLKAAPEFRYEGRWAR